MADASLIANQYSAAPPPITAKSYLDSSTPALKAVSAPTTTITKPAPAVITAQPALKKVSEAKNTLTTQTQGLKDQALANTQVKVAADQQAAQKAQEVQTSKLLSAVNDSPGASTANGLKPGQIFMPFGPEGKLTPGYVDNNGTFVPNGVPPSPTTTAAPTDDEKQAQLDQDTDSAYDQYKKDTAAIANGTFALTPDQQAQVDSLQRKFDQIKEAQKLANRNYEGGVAQAGISSGVQRYSPVLAMGQFKAAQDADNAKIADIDSQSASAIASLREGFMDKDYKRINDAFTIFNDLQKQKSATLQHKADKAQEHAQWLQDFNQKADANKYTQVTKPIQDIATEAGKNGADAKIIAAISGAKTVQDAINAAGDSLQTATGQLGDYLQYKRETARKGLVPEDYTGWKAKDDARQVALEGKKAYATGYNTAAGKAAADAKFGSGDDTTASLGQQLVDGRLAPSELSKRVTGKTSYNAVLKAADDYSMQTTGKHFDVAKADRDYKFAQRPQTQDTLNYLGSLVGTADENGNLVGGNLNELKSISNQIKRTNFPAMNNVRVWAKLSTGDVNIAKYQATITEVSDQVAKILQGGGSGGTSDAKLQQAINLFNTGFSKNQLNGVIESLQPLLKNRAISMVRSNPYLKDYADQLGVNDGPPGAKSQVYDFVKANPKLADVVAKAYEIPGATDEKVLEYTKLLQK